MERARRASLVAVLSIVTVGLLPAPAGAGAPPTTSPALPPPPSTIPFDELPEPAPESDGSADGDAAPEAPPDPADPAEPPEPANPAEPAGGAGVPPTNAPPPTTGVPVLPAPRALPRVDLSGQRRLVASRLHQARADLSLLEEQVQEIEARAAAAELRLSDVERRRQGAEADEALAVRRLGDARTDMQARATAAFIRGPLTDLSSLLEARDPNDLLRRTELVGSALRADHDAVAEYQAARDGVSDRLTRLADEIGTLNAERDAARREADAPHPEVDLARRRVSVHEAGSAVFIPGFVFPVGHPHRFVASFLAPRMTGTGFAHLHQGTDIMAPSGTPLLACERGVIAKLGTDQLGGTKLWLVGESGTRYYYAHLSAYAAGIREGLAVPAGQVIGFVGATGNARGGPAHLHYEVHPAGLDAVDPFPLLRVTDAAT